jgi:hydrogenase maturation protease
VIAVVGCGNANRRDDGIGAEVIHALAQGGTGKKTSVRLLDARTDGMAVMFAARGCETLILVDACRSGAEAGAVFEVPGAALELQQEAPLTLHEFRWNHALYAGRRLFGAAFPSAVTVFLVEAETVEIGIGLSPRVAEAAEKVVARIEDLVRAQLVGTEAAL